MPIGMYERKRRDASARFDALFTPLSPEDCWLWAGYVNTDGYGTFNVGGKMVKAHTFSYVRACGPFDSTLEIDHLCRSRACVNPRHLEPVAHRVNVRRGRSADPQHSITHCPSGHPYDEANTYRTPSGTRGCLACRRDRSRALSQSRRGTTGRTSNGLKTHCPAGHTYDAVNTFVDRENKRHCRACGRARAAVTARSNSHEE